MRDGKKRKVMFLIYSLCGGGAERVLVETVNRLPKDRYDVTLMTLFHDATRAGMLSPEVHYRPALRVKNGDDAAKLAEDLRDAIQNKQWMCGFPDKLVIATLGNYVVSVYGDEELVNTFRDKLQAAYSDAAIAYDEMIGEGEFSDGEDTALEAPVA